MYSNFTQPGKQLLLKFSLLLAFTSIVLVGSAQTPLPTFVDIKTPGVTDYSIPSDIVVMYITIAGAQGGNTTTSCPSAGGKGVTYVAPLSVGYCSPGQLIPGGTLRLITGQQGQSVTANPTVGGAGGGGGSALLYKAPLSSEWQTLVAVGGGGGDCFGIAV